VKVLRRQWIGTLRFLVEVYILIHHYYHRDKGTPNSVTNDVT
jgi:hypothetical protein